MKILEKNNVRNELLMANLVGIDTPYAKKKFKNFFKNQKRAPKWTKNQSFQKFCLYIYIHFS